MTLTSRNIQSLIGCCSSIHGAMTQLNEALQHIPDYVMRQNELNPRPGPVGSVLKAKHDWPNAQQSLKTTSKALATMKSYSALRVSIPALPQINEILSEAGKGECGERILACAGEFLQTSRAFAEQVMGVLEAAPELLDEESIKEKVDPAIVVLIVNNGLLSSAIAQLTPENPSVGAAGSRTSSITTELPGQARE